MAHCDRGLACRGRYIRPVLDKPNDSIVKIIAAIDDVGAELEVINAIGGDRYFTCGSVETDPI